MDAKELRDKQQRQKQAMRAADAVAIVSGKARPIDIAKANSCFAGVDLHKARSGKGFGIL